MRKVLDTIYLYNYLIINLLDIVCDNSMKKNFINLDKEIKFLFNSRDVIKNSVQVRLYHLRILT